MSLYNKLNNKDMPTKFPIDEISSLNNSDSVGSMSDIHSSIKKKRQESNFEGSQILGISSFVYTSAPLMSCVVCVWRVSGTRFINFL